MEDLITAVSSVMSVVGSCVTFLLGQPLLLFFLAAGLVPVGFAIFKSAKRAAKR